VPGYTSNWDVVHHYVGVPYPVSGSAVVDRGSGGLDGVGVNVSYSGGQLAFTDNSSCVTIPGWSAVTSDFTVIISFVAPASPPAVYTLWEGGVEPAVARLYVDQGTVKLSYGQTIVATGGTQISASGSFRVAGKCVSASSLCYVIM
jgi:hypothetical protein